MKNLRSSRIFVASIALGAIFLASCRPKTDGTSNATGGAQITPAPLKVIDTIFVPGTDDKLHPKKVSFGALDTQLKSGGNPIPALDEIIKLSPDWFPKGTRVMDVKENAGVVTILLSPEFGDAKHWQKGETISELAVYSLVNTLAKDGKTVALTIEGKPISTLGEFDASGALEADPTLNSAPAKTAASAKSATEKSDFGANTSGANDIGTNRANTDSGATKDSAGKTDSSTVPVATPTPA